MSSLWRGERRLTEDWPPTSLLPLHQSSNTFSLRPGLVRRLEATTSLNCFSLSSTPQYRAENTILR